MLIEQIQESIKNNKPLFIKSYLDYAFTWDNIVELISDAYNSPVGEELRPGDRSDLLYNPDYNRFTSLKIPSGGVTFIAEDILNTNMKYDLTSSKYDGIKKMKKDLEQLDSDSTVHAKFSINMSTGSPALHPHRDTHHVMLTQAIGNAKYIIHDSKESDPYGEPISVDGRTFKEYNLEKNDILFMPKGTIHSIDNNTLRAACIFDIIKKMV